MTKQAQDVLKVMGVVEQQTGVSLVGLEKTELKAIMFLIEAMLMLDIKEFNDIQQVQKERVS